MEKAGQVPELTELLQGHESLNGWSSQSAAGHIGILSQPEHTGILSQPGLNGIVSQPLLDGIVSQPQLHGWVSRQPGYSNSLRKDQEHFEDWSSDPSANAWSSTRVRRVGVFDFGTGRVGYLQKRSGTGTGRDG